MRSFVFGMHLNTAISQCLLIPASKSVHTHSVGIKLSKIRRNQDRFDFTDVVNDLVPAVCFGPLVLAGPLIFSFHFLSYHFINLFNVSTLIIFSRINYLN